MAQITYADKSTMNTNSSIPATNKCQASDMNEIKSVVNNNYSEVGNITTLTTTNKTSVVNAINEVNEKDFICCVLTTQQNITATGEATVKLNSILSQRGSGFTFANNVVTCNFDGYVEVSGQIQFSAPNTNTHNIYIHQNNSIVARSLNSAYTNSGSKVAWITPIIIQVSNGDVIKLNYYGVNGDYLNAVANSTNMTLKRL